MRINLEQLNLTHIEMGVIPYRPKGDGVWTTSNYKVRDEFGNVYNSVNELHKKHRKMVSSYGLNKYGHTVHKGIGYFRVTE